MKTCRAIDVYTTQWVAEFFYRTRHGGVSTDEPFTTVGNYGVAMEFVDALVTLDHKVRVYMMEDEWDEYQLQYDSEDQDPE